MLSFFAKDRITAPPGYNRWRVPLASVSIHLCIGSAYAWSIFNPPLTKVVGVAGSAAEDWSLDQVVWIFTVAIVFLGLSAAIAGRWLERVGPRLVGTVSALCWGGGFFIGGVGILTHQLWLLYLGYGVVGGCGLGLGYVSPVSTLIKWFPDRRGMAAGLAIMGFGGGAIIGSPLQERLIRAFYEAPVYLGKQDQVALVTESGMRYASVDGQLTEGVIVAENERQRMIVPGEAGVYVVGTGRTGVAQTFFALGSSYLIVMLLAAFSYRLPAPGWKPLGWSPPSAEVTRRKMMSRHHVDVNEALKTPQFYLLWIVLCLNVSAGIGILAVGKDMMLDIFGMSLSAVVTAAFATLFVQMMSVANMTGRIIWASASDYLGRQRTYMTFFTLGILLYASIPQITRQSDLLPPEGWLVLFYAVVMVIMTMYGGGFATIPAYLADLFGPKFVGGIHGRLLTAWSTAGVIGPLAITKLRESSRREAMLDLTKQVDPARFQEQFGTGPEQLALLIERKTVTIKKLLEIAPAGTPDPTVAIYNTTMYLMAALLAIAFIANWLVRPVDKRHYLEEDSIRSR